MNNMKKCLRTLIILISYISMLMAFVSCEESESDYKPGNPQYDYDAWKYGQDHPGFYDD